LLSACQPVSPRTLAPRRPAPRVDSQTDVSRRNHTHVCRAVPDAYCYTARMLFRMRVKITSPGSARNESVLRGLHMVVISRKITPVNSEQFDHDLLKVLYVSFTEAIKSCFVQLLIAMLIIAITPALSINKITCSCSKQLDLDNNIETVKRNLFSWHSRE